MNYFEASIVRRLRGLLIRQEELLEKTISRLRVKPRVISFRAFEDCFVSFLKRVSIGIHVVQITIQESLSISALFAISLVSLLTLLVVLVTWLVHI